MKTFYQVQEDMDEIKVCVRVNPNQLITNCPIQFPFNISLSTTSGSAGEFRY